MTTNLDDNKAVVRQMLAALNDEDWTALEKHPGLTETRQFQPLMRVAFPDLKYTIDKELVDGDLIAVRVIAQGTHQGNFMGFAPTGKPVTYQILLIDQIADGKIVDHWANPDFVTILRQIGAWPSPSHAEPAESNA